MQIFLPGNFVFVVSFIFDYHAVAFNFSLFITIKPRIKSSILLIIFLYCQIFSFFSVKELFF